MRKFEPNKYKETLDVLYNDVHCAYHHAFDIMDRLPKEITPSMRAEHQKTVNQIVELMLHVDRMKKRSDQTILLINQLQQ